MAPLEHHPIRLYKPGPVLAGRRGDVWIADTGHHRVVGADRNGYVHTILGAGSRPEGTSAPVSTNVDNHLFRTPAGLALNANEDALFVTDSRSHLIWQIDLHARTARPIADTGGAAPCALALDEGEGTLYIAMAQTHQIWRLRLRSGKLDVLAGDGTRAHRDGPYRRAAFAAPRGLALAPDRRRLYVADAGNAALRLLDLTRAKVETLVSASRPAADTPTSGERIESCVAVSVSPGGLVIIDDQQHAIRGINVRHGTATPPLFGGRAQLLQPNEITFDREHKRFIVSDSGNHRVLRIHRDLTSADEFALHRRVV